MTVLSVRRQAVQIIMKTPDDYPALLNQSAFGLVAGMMAEPVGCVTMIVEGRLMGDDEIGTQLHRLLDYLTGCQKGDDDAGDVLCGIAQLDRINGVRKRGTWYRGDNRVNGILNSQGHERYSPFSEHGSCCKPRCSP